MFCFRHMRRFCNHPMRLFNVCSLGDKYGRPRLRPNEVIPTAPFKRRDMPKSRHAVYMPNAFSPHPKMKPMRGMGVKRMITGLLNLGLKPCAIKAKNVPSKEAFDNYNHTLYAGYVFYCDAQGLTNFHDVARSVHPFTRHTTTTSPPRK